MKLTILFGLFILIFFSQGSIYDIEVQPVEGGSAISISSFAGKKIIITPINSLTPDTARLKFLDSLQNTDTSLRVIAVPAIDFEGTGSNEAISNLKEVLSADILITTSASVKKSAGNDQHPLFKWLTNVGENRHFDIDVSSAGQLFVVSGSGTLYSVLPGDVPAQVLTQVLNQSVTQ
ncbi:MAG: hypothetical protein ABIO55_02130 [Ginsengibacter sp.]